MAQQWLYELMRRHFRPISNLKLRNIPQPATISSFLGRTLLAIIITTAIQLLPIKQGLGAEGPSANNTLSTSNAADNLEKKIYQSVKDFEYSDQVASDFVKMIQPWKCDVLYQKLCQAAEDVKQEKISWDQYAQVEEEAVNQLAQTIKKEIAPADTKVESNWKYFDLAIVVKDKKAHCLGYTQLFYILGNSMGLAIQAVDVLERSKGQLPDRMGHVACEVGLHNNKTMQVDLTLRDCVSKEFLLADAYANVGDNWELNDKNNPLNIHPKIKLLDKNGLLAGIYSTRGTVYIKSGKLTEAISVCTKAIELNPNSAMAYCNRANALGNSGKLSDAISDLNKAIDIDPKNAVAYCSRGTTYRRAGKLNEAISDFSKAIELNPKLFMAYFNRGAAFIRAGQPDKALSDCDKAIELNPNSAEAYGNRGATNAILGNTEDAKNDLRKAMQLNPRLKESVQRISDQYELDL
ncbi:MAG: tetratricopeptide repeat protein [Thermoguttaceae bacterium]|jgi:Flp pilus assembly protein TadD